MDRKLFFVAFTWLSQALPSCSSAENGAVIAYASHFIRPNGMLEIFLSSSYDADVVIEAIIQGKNEVRISNQTTLIQAGQRKTIQLPVGSRLPSNPYSLKLLARSWGVDLTSELEMLMEESLVLIQLDKPMYKPGDLINYRVLVLNSDFKLQKNVTTIDVRLRNPDGSVADEHRGLKNKNVTYPGHFEGFFGLPNFDPEFGTWTLEAAGSEAGIVKKQFLVEYYRLPSFSLDVTPPPFMQENQRTLRLIIEMRDAIGSPIVGTVEVELNNGADSPQKFPPMVIDGVKEKDYQLDLDSLHEEYCTLDKPAQPYITITATGVESFSKKSVTITKMVPYFCDAFKMSITLPSHHFHPGAETNATVRILAHDGNQYRLQSGYTWTSDHFSGRQHLDDEEAEDLTIREPIPIDDTTVILPFRSMSNAKSVEITVNFQNKDKTFTFKARSKHAELTIDEVTRTYGVGERVNFTLGCTQACSRMEYVIVTRKGVLPPESVPMTGESSGRLNITVTPDMAPFARIVAYYLKGKDIFSAGGEFRVKESSIISKVNVTQPANMSQTYIKPGNTTRLEVTGKPNSLVGLLAISKSLLQLKTGNDITADEVITKYRSLLPPLFNGDPGLCGQEEGENQCLYRRHTAAFAEANLVVHVLYPNHIGDPLQTEKARLRKDFRDSFLFTTAFTDSQGRCSLLSAVPDSITTWSITAFTASTEHALGLTSIPAEVKVYQDFYISMDLPHTLIENEWGFFNVTVFNLRGQSISMALTVEVSTLPNQKQLSKSNDRAQLFRFRLGPFKKGNQKVTVTISDVSHPDSKELDRVQKNISVIHSGVVEYWTSDVVRLANEPVDIPVGHSDAERIGDVVPESTSCQLHIYSDSLGVPVRDLAAEEKTSVVFRSYADSAEQIMARFMGNLFWLRLLAVSGDRISTTKTESEKTAYNKKRQELIDNLEIAYKRLSHYRLEDGSYNTLGSAREPGSTWLTAYVVQGLALAKTYMPINSNQWEHSLKFLESKQQMDDGSFQERGVVVDKAYQGAAGKNPALTAFVVLAYTEAGMNNEAVRRAKNYLDYQVHGSTPISPQALAIVCYALNRLGSEKGRHCIHRLEEAATNVPEKKYWNATEGGRKKAAVDAETTAYALLALHNGSYIGDLSPVINWLTSLRHSPGKFKPTQDKVMILRAFSEVAHDYLNSDQPLLVDVYADAVKNGSAKISPYDTELKYFDLPRAVQKVTLKGTGRGKGRGQVQCKYNKITTSTRPVTTAKNILEANATLGKFGGEVTRLLLEVCVRYHSNKPSGMVTIKIPALSGYKFYKPDEPKTERLFSAKIKVLPYTDSGTKAHIVIIEIARSQTVCVEEILIKASDIINPVLQPIRVYLEDDESVRTVVTYSLADLK